MTVNESSSVVSEGIVALILNVEVNNAEDAVRGEKRCERVNDRVVVGLSCSC